MTPRDLPLPCTPAAQSPTGAMTPESQQATPASSLFGDATVTDCVLDFTLDFEVEEPEDMKQEEDDSSQGDAEVDLHRLAQRQKQVDFGKNTLGYQRYIEAIPKESRRWKHGYCLDPCTPDVYQKCSKRCFDGQVKKWRRDLHRWDPDYKPDYKPKSGKAAQKDTVETQDTVEISDSKLPTDRKRGFDKAFKGGSESGCMFAPLGVHNRPRNASC